MCAMCSMRLTPLLLLVAFCHVSSSSQRSYSSTSLSSISSLGNLRRSDDRAKASNPRPSSHVFQEAMPYLQTRDDVVKNARVLSDVIHEVIFVIKQLNMKELFRILHDVSDPLSVNYGQHLSRLEVSSLTSNPESLSLVSSFLEESGARIKSVTLDGDFVTCEAPISVWESLLNTEFYSFQQKKLNGEYAHSIRAETYSVPAHLEAHVASILNTIEMPYNERGGESIFKELTDDLRKTAEYGVVTPAKLNSVYNMTGSGSEKSTQAIFATIGQNVSPTDLTQFQTDHGLRVQGVDVINDHNSHAVCVKNAELCSESNLDVQYIMAASQKSPTTHWYTDQGFNAWLVAVSNSPKPPLVLSISYGTEEKYISKSLHDAFNVVALKLSVMGVTIFVSSGDDGVLSRNVRGGSVKSCRYVSDFPAASQYVTAVGATSGVERDTNEVVAQGNTPGQVITSGGGFSTYYPRPSWQTQAVEAYFASAAAAGIKLRSGYNSSMRAYPDISLAGSNYLTVIAGKEYLLSGTSASAPTLAGYFSNINAARFEIGKGSVGWINPTLYSKGSQFVNDITSGDNRCAADGTCCPHGFHATEGWDPTTGLGSVNFGKMQSVFLSLGTATPGFSRCPTTYSTPTPPPTRRVTFAPSTILSNPLAVYQSTGSDAYVVAVAIGTLISLMSAIGLALLFCCIRERCTPEKIPIEEDKKMSTPTATATPIGSPTRTLTVTPVLYPVNSYAYSA